MPMKSEELAINDTKTCRSSSRRLRSLMSRTNVCQRPSGRMLELTSTGTRVPSFRCWVHSARSTSPGHEELLTNGDKPGGVLGRDNLEDRLADQFLPLVPEQLACGDVHVGEPGVEIRLKKRIRCQVDERVHAILHLLALTGHLHELAREIANFILAHGGRGRLPSLAELSGRLRQRGHRTGNRSGEP